MKRTLSLSLGGIECIVEKELFPFSIAIAIAGLVLCAYSIRYIKKQFNLKINLGKQAILLILVHLFISGTLVVGLLASGSDLYSFGKFKENMVNLLMLTEENQQKIASDPYLRARVRSDLKEAQRNKNQGLILLILTGLPVISFSISTWQATKLKKK